MFSSKRMPVLAVTMGDPSGIGPEIIAHLFSGFRPSASTPLLIGSHAVIKPWATRFGLDLAVWEGGRSEEPGAENNRDSIRLFDTGCEEKFIPGEHCEGGGKHAGVAIRTACDLVDEGKADGIVTAPISKIALNMGGFSFPGHTEMLADRFKVASYEMMMVYGGIRVVPLTRHMPLSQVSSVLNKERILNCLQTVDRALRRLFGLAQPRIALAALNPHSGDQGLAGNEEVAVIIPALREAKSKGINVDGPIPADVMFQDMVSEAYDAYISVYHDQGLIPFKMIAGRKGVNLTIGLPVIRTSVDHGVAFDISGQGVASTASLREAYLLAEKLTNNIMKRD